VTHRTLDQWLSYLESLHPTEIELGLARIQQVAARLAINPGSAQVITVAGTNGKGSTCAMLDQILQQHGKTTARYSSPHLIRFNERVMINGQPVDDDALIEAFEQVDTHRQDISLTYFEFTTLAAFWLFQQQAVDVWILEVGLGGRLDAVNILDADVAVVTSIALDHQDWLGSDLVQIGREKAGIARADRPLVCGQSTNIQGVRQVAEEVGARLYLRDRDFNQHPQADFWNFEGLDVSGQPVKLDQLLYPMLPPQNAATALQALSLLPFSLDLEKVKVGLQKATLAGRMQEIKQGSLKIVLDVAHNPQAATMLVQQWQARGLPAPTVVLGMLSDKDIGGTTEILSQLNPAAWWLVDLPGTRGKTAAQLANYVPNQAVELRQFSSVEQALSQTDQSSDYVLICGSFLTVGAALEFFQTSR
jgi:dihydrofolate synthase/folylpolyglutamate synthase